MKENYYFESSYSFVAIRFTKQALYSSLAFFVINNAVLYALHRRIYTQSHVTIGSKAISSIMSDSSSSKTTGNDRPFTSTEAIFTACEAEQPPPRALHLINNANIAPEPMKKELSKQTSDSGEQFTKDREYPGITQKICIFCRCHQNISSLMSCVACGMAYHSRCMAIYIQPSALRHSTLSVEERKRIDKVVADVADCLSCQNASINFCRDETFDIDCRCRVCTEPELVLSYRKKVLFLMLKDQVRLDDYVPRVVNKHTYVKDKGTAFSEVVKEKPKLIKRKLIRRIKGAQTPTLTRTSSRINGVAGFPEDLNPEQQKH